MNKFEILEIFLFVFYVRVLMMSHWHSKHVFRGKSELQLRRCKCLGMHVKMNFGRYTAF